MGGKRVTGNGHVTAGNREVSTFNSLAVSGSITVRVRQDATPSVRIETDDNLFPYIEVYNDGNTVVIREKRGYNLDPSKDIIAYVSAPVFRGIDLSGSCDVISDNTLTGNEPLEVSLSGSGNVNLDVNLPSVRADLSGSPSLQMKGSARDFRAGVSGSGDVKCFDLKTDNTELDISGSADAQVYAEKQLKVSVSGSGEVQYRGNATVDQHVSGSGSVRKAG